MIDGRGKKREEEFCVTFERRRDGLSDVGAPTPRILAALPEMTGSGGGDMRPLETSTEWRRDDDLVLDRFLSRVEVDRVIGGVLNMAALRDLGAGVLGSRSRSRSALSDEDPLDDFSSFSGDERLDLDLTFFSSLRALPAVHILQEEEPSRLILGRSFLDLLSVGGVNGASGTAGGMGGGGGGAAAEEDRDFLDFLGFSGDSIISTISSSSTSAGNDPGRSLDFLDLRLDSDGGAGGGGGGGGTSMTWSSPTSKARSLSATLPPTAFRGFVLRELDCASVS